MASSSGSQLGLVFIVSEVNFQPFGKRRGERKQSTRSYLKTLLSKCISPTVQRGESQTEISVPGPRL